MTLRPQLVAFGLVAALNLLVVVYHGDPWLKVAEAAGLSSNGVPKPAAAKPIESEEVVSEEVVFVAGDELVGEGGEELDGPPSFLAETYRPLAGLRSGKGYDSVLKAVLKRNQTPAGVLYEAGVDKNDVAGILNSLEPYVDFRRLRPGNYFKLFLDKEQRVQSVDLYKNALEQSSTRRGLHGWLGEKVEIPIETAPAAVKGTISSSLWVALKATGESAQLVNEFVDVFAWDIDFYSEVFPGDTFRVLVEKKFSDGDFIGYGNIEAAEFVSAGKVFRAYMHEEEDGAVGYFDEDGNSMRKQLLKSPLKYGHVTSRFGKRRHPILGYTRAHNGIDYGVPTGTPTWSVGEGRVVTAGWHRGFGKFVEIKYANGWLAQYAHLSKIKVKKGQRVSQKQIIGLTGSTGMSTGPHLHYGLKRHGKFVNPLAQSFSRGKALTGKSLELFKGRLGGLKARLDQISSESGS